MSTITETDLGREIRVAALPLEGIAADYDWLLRAVGDARYVLLGEASHGTHEFYQERAQITQRLIEEKGFTAVAAEADWPDAWRVNRFVQGVGADQFGHEALGDFKRFPTWMWRNTVVAEFVDWLRQHNEELPTDARAGFYGMDLYSLHTSMDAVLRFLDKVDPQAAKHARERYSCFDRYGPDDQVYGFLAASGATPSCKEQVVEQLMELQKDAAEYARRQPRIDRDELFHAEQNARLVKNAEQYYRTMFTRGGESTWNLRDRHMMETLQALERHLERKGVQPKIVVWAHNSHLGDARATEMGWRRGEINVGQLVRQAHGNKSKLIGFTTARGTVTAAADWGEPAQRKKVRDAMEHSYEALFHDTKMKRFLLDLRTGNEVTRGLRDSRLERAIGVVYHPKTERVSHYFDAELPSQFDVVLHFDETRALEPLERNAEWQKGDAPETYPFGV
jgi:erythromycin esterase-like protein